MVVCTWLRRFRPTVAAGLWRGAMGGSRERWVGRAMGLRRRRLALGSVGSLASLASAAALPATRSGDDKADVAGATTYKRMKPVEHVLLRPGMYVGSVSPAEDLLWCYDAKAGRMVQKAATVVPALFKIIDEVLVNAADNHHRSAKTARIDVAVDVAGGRITIRNDGPGIPVDFAKGESDIRTPELVFGHLLTGSNFDDSKKRYTGGRHGYGAKLANIFSTEFKVETHDLTKKVKYTQTWRRNMSECEPPVIEPMQEGVVPTFTTTISFLPELRRFGMDELDDEVVAAIRKRTYDLAGSLGGRVALSWQGVPLDDCKNFREWAGLFEPKVSAAKKAKDAKEAKGGNDKGENVSTVAASAEAATMASASGEAHDKFPGLVTTEGRGRWSVGVSCSPGGSFSQVTLVNSIATTRGGSHVNHVCDQVSKRLAEMIQQRHREFAVRSADVKHHLRLYIACLIDNPEFDSQVSLSSMFCQSHVHAG